MNPYGASFLQNLIGESSSFCIDNNNKRITYLRYQGEFQKNSPNKIIKKALILTSGNIKKVGQRVKLKGKNVQQETQLYQKQQAMLELVKPVSKSKMIVKTVTWLKDSHQLFDYEFTKNIVKQQFTISLQHSYVFFYRNNAKSEVMFIKKQEIVPNKIEGAQLLGCFEIVPTHHKKFKIQFHESSEFAYQSSKARVETQVSNNSGDYKHQRVYFIVRSLKDDEHEPKGFVLKTGQKVKFGRLQYSVSVIKKGEKPEECPKFFQYEETLEMKDKIYGEEEACKICLSNQQSEPNSFFCTPCDCFGSCSIVHFDCLFMWCKTKVKKSKVGKIIHYNFEKFECEICKKYFPRFIVRNSIKYDLLPIDKPEDSYMVLTSNAGTSQTEKSLIMIGYTQENVLKIGRNQTCDIRIVDIAVSRQHASIETRNGQFYLYDNKSKFGTIVSEPNFYLDVEKVKRGIQVGRTVLTFQLADKDWEKQSKC